MKLTRKDKRTSIERKIDEQLEDLMEQSLSPKELSEMIDLMKRREELTNTKRRISPDTIAIIAGNLLGIVLILGYEKANVISSKALGFVLKGRV